MASWSDTFSAFVRRKTHAAATAVMPPYVTLAAAPQPQLVAIGNSWTRRLFDGPFYVPSGPLPQRPACSLVFVQSISGNTVAPDPSSLGGGETDKHLIYEGLSRVAVDAVLVGAGTVRGSGAVFSVWHPDLVELRKSLGLSRHPVQLVATLHGMELDRELIFNVPEVPVIILNAAPVAPAMEREVSERPWIRVIATGGPDAMTHAFSRLRAFNVQRISCVGGRELAASLLDLDLVDDVYLTTSPSEGGQANTPLYSHPLRGTAVVRKRGTAAESGVVFEHLHLARG